MGWGRAAEPDVRAGCLRPRSVWRLREGVGCVFRTMVSTRSGRCRAPARAQCGSAARWDLCGGRAARPVPTATDALAMLHAAASGALHDVDRLATAALREAARRKKKLVERDVLARVLDTVGTDEP